MGRITVGQWTGKNEEFTRNLKAGLTREGRDYKDLMRRTGRSQSAIYARYNRPGTITVDELRGFIQEAKLSEEDVLNLLFIGR